ncbi:MAG: ABC transporter permease, partial [Alphaproteobacteria bacterium]|nr:ABC transporter permease [Alphaproteobacteria bacterium]
MGLWNQIATRVGYGLLLLIAVLVLNFTLISIAPGDVADSIAGDMGGADADVMEEIRTRYGLDQPFYIQLWRYVSRVAVFDLGYSYFYNAPVTSLILEKLPATLLLVLSAQILAVIVGTLLGVIAAKKPNGILSLMVTFLSLFGFAAPVFWTGILLIILFVSIFPLFPVGGMVDVTVEGGFFVQTLDVLYHLFLPMITLASIFLALYSRLARASMLEVLGADYVRTARAKGVPERTVLYKHALKNALGPVVTVAGLQFSAVISGAVVVETVYSWPGLGTLAL